MTKRAKPFFKRRGYQPPRQKKSIEYILEHGTLAEMRLAKEQKNALLRYHWAYYSELSQQRNAIQTELTKSLLIASRSNFPFKGWQRAVKLKYSIHPLSVVGSLNRSGRFNTGIDVSGEVPTFPALYLAEDKDTALQKTLGQSDPKQGLNPLQLALTSTQSMSFVSVSGELETVFDLTKSKNLGAFLKLLKGFEVSESLKRMAKEVGEPVPDTIKTVQMLQGSLLDPDWRAAPQRFNVPANSQIFGHLLYLAGIEAVLYPSKLNGKK